MQVRLMNGISDQDHVFNEQPKNKCNYAVTLIALGALLGVAAIFGTNLVAPEQKPQLAGLSACLLVGAFMYCWSKSREGENTT